MDRKQLGSVLLLLLAALIWGGSFVAQHVGLDILGPMTFNAIRFFIGGTVLLPVVLLRRRSAGPAQRPLAQNGQFWRGGILCGIFLCVASAFQQFGMLYTTAGKSAFVTTLYVVLVPIAGILLHRKPGLHVWIGAILAACGLYLLCVSEAFTLNRGDVITLGAAVCFAVHILLIGRYAAQADGIALSCLQFFTAGALCLVGALLTERATLEQIYACRYLLLYAGALSCGVGYTAQILGQKHTDATLASLLMCLESVFAVLAGWIFLNEALSAREWVGCILMFTAIVLAQLPEAFWRRLFKGRATQEQPQG